MRGNSAMQLAAPYPRLPHSQGSDAARGNVEEAELQQALEASVDVSGERNHAAYEADGSVRIRGL